MPAIYSQTHAIRLNMFPQIKRFAARRARSVETIARKRDSLFA